VRNAITMPEGKLEKNKEAELKKEIKH